MEDDKFHKGYLYEFDIMLDPKYSVPCETNFRGYFISHDTVTNIFIFQEEKKKSSPQREAAKSIPSPAKSIPSLRLINGECIAKPKPNPLIHLKERKHDNRKEWESYISRKAKEEEERAQEAFSILSESYGERVKWQGQDIVLKNQVRVSRPYLPENVTLELSGLLEEVKQKLERFKSQGGPGN